MTIRVYVCYTGLKSRYELSYNQANKLDRIGVFRDDELYVEVSVSSIHGAGYGLFAKTRLLAGDAIGVYPGRRIGVGEITEANKPYLLNVGKDVYLDGWLVAHSIYEQQLDRIVGVELSTLLCFTNHVSRSSGRENIRPTKSRGGHYYEPTFYAVQNIEVGDELLWTYIY
uniref:SET domain-containing protein n=1 Tax=Pyramimonas orientalis virus TaxID=455367 RepID=A0A7M3UPF8_POV01|nr:SET domain-containing protein [Pyramimonas orientalis virus]